MSCFFKYAKETTVHIPKYEEKNNIIYYEIKVKINTVEWTTLHRYREFRELHEKLVIEQSISKRLLPPKKLIGNKNAAFLESRRKELEEYLENLLGMFRISMPREFACFLDFNKYDTVYLLQDLAEYFCTNGERILCSIKEYIFTPLELYAITERTRLPCPPSNEKDYFDFSHVLDFCYQIESIIISPVKHLGFGSDYNAVDVPIGGSNIIPKNLRFDLNSFRSLKVLKFQGISPENLLDASGFREGLNSFYIHNTTVQRMNQILMCDILHRNDNITDESILNLPKWESIEILDCSGNLLTTIDKSIKLVPRVKILNLHQNRLKNINNLSWLHEIRELNLGANLIADCSNWNTELGNLVTLNLSQNKIQTLKGLEKLYSLVNLDLSCNQVCDLDEIDYIANLPLLENLRLTGNPLAASVDYRPRVLARFHERASEMCLDNEKGDSKELDMALVLSALHCSQKGKYTTNNNTS